MSKKIFNYLEVLHPFTKDLERGIYGRELARKLEMNQKTVQNHLNEMEEEGLLKSIERGRIKEFRLNRENVLARKLLVALEIKKFYDLLSSSFEVREIIEEILRQTAGHVIVYGSFAKGDWKEDSDLDVLLIDASGEDELKELRKKYSRNIHFMFMGKEEFVGGMRARKPYLQEILQNHIICRGFEEITDWRFENE